ncbi:MAG: hypothetical protein WC841_05720 [Candidatus Shapirobacteria bacterium]|jgi:hypothetical protein
MDEINYCAVYHQSSEPLDYYCRNCGKSLRPRPLSTSVRSQLVLYIKTLLLPPFGFIWGYRYLRQSDTVSKLVGLFTVLITTAEIIWLIQSTVNTFTTVNQEIYRQMKLYGL